MTDRKHGALPVPDHASEPVVAFYLTQETTLPAKFQGHRIVTIQTLDPFGRLAEKPALRVTFSHDQSIEDPVGLLMFGSDPRCHVLLPAEVVDPLHCGVYAQLKSGPQAWLVEDHSAQGINVQADYISRNKQGKFVHGRRQAVQGTSSIALGPYRFRIRLPTGDAEIQRGEDWFRLNQNLPVTKSMLDRQLGGIECEWIQMERIGKGGFGNVYKYMEGRTALFVAVKEQKLENPGDQVAVKKEIDYMETLRHPYLVDFLSSECNRKQAEPTQYTTMPLYLGNLWALLIKNPDIKTKERIVVQIFEGVNYMHRNHVLHRDLKPDNIFLVSESPALVKVGDYGLATSLADRLTLLKPCGTAAYMAPEIFQRNFQTTAIDIFSLGATVFAIMEHEIVMRGWYKRGRQKMNHAFEGVASSPPKLYAGLVQSMMAPNPRDRPSLDLCIEVVKGQYYKWTKGTQLVPVRTAATITPIQRDPRRPASAAKGQQTPLDRARAWAAKKGLEPIAQRRLAEIRRSPQQAPVERDSKRQRGTRVPQQPQTPGVQPVAVQAKAQREPAPVKGVNFQDGLPSYEEATSKNPFVKLLDSNEITRKRHRPKLNLNQDQGNPATEQHPSNPRQIIRRPRDHAQALDIHRVGTGRIQRATVTGLKTGFVEMGMGLWKVGKGFGITARNAGCLTVQSMLTLYDIATGREDLAPQVGLRLNDDEMRVVISMRADSRRQETRRQRVPIGGKDDAMVDAPSIAVGRPRRLRRITEGTEVGGGL